MGSIDGCVWVFKIRLEVPIAIAESCINMLIHAAILKFLGHGAHTSSARLLMVEVEIVSMRGLYH